MATEILRPNANGDTIEFSPQPDDVNNYENIDEETADDGTMNWAGAETLDAKDLYALPNHSEGSGTINKITVHGGVGGNTGAGEVDAKFIVKTGGTIYEGDALTISTDIETTQTFDAKSQVWETNPKTNKAWTWDDIDGLQIGIHGYGFEAGESVAVYITQIYLEVDYTEEEEESPTEQTRRFLRTGYHRSLQ